MGVKLKKKRPVVLPAIVLLTVFWLLYRMIFGGAPGERALVKRFQKNRAAFNELLAMVSTNPPGGPTREDAVWSVDDYRHYQELASRAGVIKVNPAPDEFRFLVAEAPPGRVDRLGIAWRLTRPERVLSRLSEFRKSGKQPEQAYCPLEENWYLWIER